MKIYKTSNGIVVEKQQEWLLGKDIEWDSFINRPSLYEAIQADILHFTNISKEEFSHLSIHAPIKHQEVWASGVTYLRSRDARMEESKDAGGGTFYDKVYEADRPELFFKSTAHRVVGPNDPVRIRKDSTWNVPEPELTLFINSLGTISGYTIGNDMSSRSIEGENPLYLPQAKTYDGSAALGPCILVKKEPIATNALIEIEIDRKGNKIFSGSITIDRMKRKHEELVGYLFREASFPYGCFLMTGTGIIPPNEFTLQQGDDILITIEHIGTLKNTVA